jgi:hypothetical protein
MPDRLATQLLRVSRDPGSGRLRHQSPLAIGLRAALFTDLVLAGRVISVGPAPAVGPVGPTDDRILEAVARTVEKRPNVAWWRWYRHVRVDIAALTDELVDAGRWTPRPSALGRTGYDDVDPDSLAELTFTATRIGEFSMAPADSRQAVLAILTVMCGSIAGRPRPRALRRDLKPLLTAAAQSGERGAHQIPPVLNGAERLMRRPLRRS